ISQVIKQGECDIPTLQKQDTSTLRLQQLCGISRLMELTRAQESHERITWNIAACDLARG
ncbi:hypothetical protein ACC740_16605, partial [Rhizobium ruizarguesonis]